MAIGRYVGPDEDEEEGQPNYAPEPEPVGGAALSSPPGELFPDEEGRIVPDATTQGSRDEPREILGPGRDEPTRPPDVQLKSPTQLQGTSAQSGGGEYTPTQPRSPSPVAGQPP